MRRAIERVTESVCTFSKACIHFNKGAKYNEEETWVYTN